MSQASHTLGPWTVESDPSHFGTSTTVVGGLHTPGYLHRDLIIQVGGYADIKLLEANAHLISAAPEMLEALEHMVTQFGCDCGHTFCRACNDSKEAKAVIAKAKGLPNA